MKKFYVLFLVTMMGTFLYAQDSVNVTLAVDMSQVTEVDSNGVHLAGNLQDNFAGTTCPEWTPDCTTMADANEDGVWKITLRLPKDSFEYKYINGNAWGTDETNITPDCGTDNGQGSNNRILDLTIASGVDTIVGPFLFDDCALSTVDITSNDKDVSLPFDVAPNPATDMLRVNLGQIVNAEVTMTSISGKLVYQVRNAQNVVEIARRDLPAGLYMITVRNEEGKFSTQKVVLQ
ncbi:MAG: T9SS type A sorting domain-containing protein [Bacteroidota bacterium]